MSGILGLSAIPSTLCKDMPALALFDAVECHEVCTHLCTGATFPTVSRLMMGSHVITGVARASFCPAAMHSGNDRDRGRPWFSMVRLPLKVVAVFFDGVLIGMQQLMVPSVCKYLFVASQQLSRGAQSQQRCLLEAAVRWRDPYPRRLARASATFVVVQDFRGCRWRGARSGCCLKPVGPRRSCTES